MNTVAVKSCEIMINDYVKYYFELACYYV